MPETVAAYIATNTLTAASVLTANQILVATYVAFAAATVTYSQGQRRKAERRARAAAAEFLRDRNVTTRGSIETRQLVLGRVRTGGTIIFIGSTGANKEKLTLVIALASHRIAGIDEVWLNDEALTLDVNGYPTSGSYVKTSLEDATANITITAGAGSITLPDAPTGAVRLVVPAASDAGNESFFSGTVAGAGVTFSGVTQESITPYTGPAVVQYQVTRVQSRVRVRAVLGGADQAAFADLITQFPDQWTADHRGRGVAYLVAELDYDPDVFPSGIPNISAVVRGADEVFDPRTGTTGYSENPALLMRHYLLHPLGGRRTARQISDEAVIAAANVCDRVVDYGSGATALYKAGIVASTELTPAAVCDELAEAMAGRWGYSSGVVRMRAGDVGAAVASIDESWLAAGALQVQPHRPRAELANTLRGTFIDPASGWQPVPFTAVPQDPSEAAALAAEDGGVVLPQELEFAAINRAGQAQQVAAVLLREQRQGLTVSLQCTMRAYSLQLFDVVSLTVARFGWEGKLFEVVGRTYTLGGAIQLVLRETGSSIYAFGTSFPAGDALPNTSLPNPRVVPQVGTVTASSGAAVLPDGSVVSRVVLSWPAVPDRNVTEGGFIEVGFREAADTTGGLRVVRADSFTGHTMVGLRGGRGYVFAARAVNGLGVRGLWSALTAHVVYLVRGPLIFRQADEPVGDVRVGDIWFDTNDSNKQYVRETGAWVLVRDAGIQQALDDAAAAQAAADGKIASFYQASPPGAADEGDLWFDTDDGNKQYIRQGGIWVVAADTRIGDALDAAADAQATADGKVVTFVQTTAPTAEAVGDLWLDSDDGNKLYRWNGTSWVALPVGTGGLATSAATEVAVDDIDLAGATYSTGTTTIRTIVTTPPVACLIEFTASIEATNVDGDSGNAIGWSVTPSGGSAVELGGQNLPSAAKFKHTAFASYSAAAGVELTFALKFSRAGANPAMAAYKSYMRATLIKR